MRSRKLCNRLKSLSNKKEIRLLAIVFFAVMTCVMMIGHGMAGNSSSIQMPSADGPLSSEQISILSRKFVTNIVHIPGGHHPVPIICEKDNTEYILDGDITADGTAVLVRASKVVINLNGNTITYNQTIPGEGVYIDVWNKTDIAITNGTIIQGAAMSEGDVYGGGNNPVRSKGLSSRLQIALIKARYGGRDVGGFYVSAANSIFEQNILEDTWTIGTFKNRHQGIDALAGSKNSSHETNNIYRYNTIINCRQRGINTGKNSIAYGNKITINSLATNATGIAPGSGSKIYENTIIGKGEHPIGIFYVSKEGGVEIFNNFIDVQTTKIGEEYGKNPKCFDSNTPCGNFAVGFRTTWRGNNINFHDNTIIVRTDSAYKGRYSPTGKPVVVNGKGRGLMVAINAGENARFYNNTITALDKDGTGKAYGIACTGGNTSPDLVFAGNTVTSNILNVALSDEYGACAGHPLFISNTFIKAGNYPSYKTVAAELGGYFEATGSFVSNEYKGGASQEIININAKSKTRKSVYFGREITAALVNAPAFTPLKAATLTIQDTGTPFNSTVTTGPDGMVKTVIYDYELHNDNGAGSASVSTRYLSPHTLSLRIDSTLFTTHSNSTSGAWDALSAEGSYVLPLYDGSGEVDNSKKLTIIF